MELHSAPRLIPGGAPDDRCARYLDRLPLGADRRRELLVRLRAYGTRLREAMTELHQALGGHPAPSDDPALASQRRRLDLAFGESHAGEASAVATDVHGRARLVTTPPLARASMAPPTWTRGWLARCLHPWRGPHIVGGGRRASDRRREARPPPESPDPQGAWHRAGLTRRITLLMLVIAQTVVATEFMTAVLPYHGRQPLEIVLLVLFAILFGWVSAGFWTAMAGFLLLLTGRDRFSVTRSLAENKPIDKGARTAIIMPICNEDVVRVFAGLRATYESLEGTGELAHFDFFVLSDTNDADARVAETRAWLGLCRAVDGFGRVFYRWRQHHIKRKSGNVADFCRRWGRNYRYMVVLDADSVMSGECLTALVRIAEANPDFRHHPDRAARRRSRHPVCTHAAVRDPRVRSALHRRTAFLAARRIPLLGTQRNHPCRAVHASLRARTPSRPRLPVGGDPVARLRRSRADAPRRLGRVDRLRPPRQLRGDAAQPNRRAEARSPLVPGQPDELPPVH